MSLQYRSLVSKDVVLESMWGTVFKVLHTKSPDVSDHDKDCGSMLQRPEDECDHVRLFELAAFDGEVC